MLKLNADSSRLNLNKHATLKRARQYDTGNDSQPVPHHPDTTREYINKLHRKQRSINLFFSQPSYLLR